MADSWKTWQEALEEVNLARFLHYRDFLSALYLHLKGEIKGFSYLQFAAALGLGSNNSILRLVIAGKRRLTPRAAERIGEHLRLSGTRRRYWLTLVRYNTAKDPGEADRLLQRLMKLKTKLQPEGIDETRLAYFAEWYHPVIREMAARPDFQMDARWIQSRIGFPVRLEDIKKSLELLTRLGLIHFDARSDSWVRSDEPIDTGPEARGIAFIRYHQKMIGLGSQAIDHMERAK